MRTVNGVPPRGSLKIEQCSWKEVPEYRQFAAATFGTDNYQASERYLHWLYQQNPLSRGIERDMWVVRAESCEIVGCIHTMRLAWTREGQIFAVPTLHNTMMHPDHRGIAGGILILQAFRGEAHAFVPGAEGAVAEALLRLRFVTVSTSWSRQILRPIAAGAALVARHLNWRVAPVELMKDSDAQYIDIPNDIAGCVKLANRGEPEEFRPCWTTETFFWRFFHPEGPRHLLFIEGPLSAPIGYAIISIGVRHGVRLARVVDLQAPSSELKRRLLARCAAASKRQNAAVILNFAGGTEESSLEGWQRHGTKSQTLFFHRVAQKLPLRYRFNASSGDYGFEAIMTHP